MYPECINTPTHYRLAIKSWYSLQSEAALNEFIASITYMYNKSAYTFLIELHYLELN